MSTATAKLSPAIEPVTRKFLDTLNASTGPQLYELSPQEARKVLQSVTVDVEKLPAEIEDIEVPVGPGGKVSLRIVRPKGSSDTLPAVMYFHGGGWVCGDKDTHDRLIRELANGANAAIVFVNYTNAPEAQYPTQNEEAYAATKYIAENAQKHKLDVSKLVVAGDSVGGNMAIAVSLMAKERGGPEIAYQICFYPVTDANFDNATYREYAEHHFLTREAMKWFWNNYAPKMESRKEILCTPLNATVEQLKGLPPTMIINGEFDVLREEGEAFAHKLNEAGVSVKALRIFGTIHDFALLAPLAATPAPRAAIALVSATLKELFAKK